MLKQYQRVRLVRESLSDTFFGKRVKLRRGQRGVIVEIYDQPGIPTGYEVEFFDKEGETVSVTTLEEGDIEPLFPRDTHTRARKSSRGAA
jgi:hypothetical protein